MMYHSARWELSIGWWTCRGRPGQGRAYALPYYGAGPVLPAGIGVGFCGRAVVSLEASQHGGKVHVGELSSKKYFVIVPGYTASRYMWVHVVLGWKYTYMRSMYMYGPLRGTTCTCKWEGNNYISRDLEKVQYIHVYINYAGYSTPPVI